MGPEVLIALGGNLESRVGPPVKSISYALQRFGALGLRPVAISRFFETPCFPAGAGPDYVNATVTVQTDLTAGEVLSLLHQIEEELGRTRDERWGMRTLDLDLIAYGDLVLPDAAKQREWQDLPVEEQMRVSPDQLILPHPRLQDRAFVLVPLLDIAANWHHPLLGRSVRDMTGKLSVDDVQSVRAL